MNYNEFAFYYMILPWLIAGIGFIAAVLIIVIGGPELRTIIGGKMSPKAHFVLGWIDGGKTVLKTYTPLEPGVMADADGKEFITYTTPQTATKAPIGFITIEDARRALPNMSDEALQAIVNEENQKRAEAGVKRDVEMVVINEMAKTKASFAGKPLWLGHLSVGAAVQPELGVLLEQSKYRKRPLDKAVQRTLDVVNPDTIKEFMNYNFSSGLLYSILRRGIDYGKYGKPKKPFPMIILIVVFVALGMLLIGGLILSGKINLSGWVKGLGLGM